MVPCAQVVLWKVGWFTSLSISFCVLCLRNRKRHEDKLINVTGSSVVRLKKSVHTLYYFVEFIFSLRSCILGLITDFFSPVFKSSLQLFCKLFFLLVDLVIKMSLGVLCTLYCVSTIPTVFPLEVCSSIMSITDEIYPDFLLMSLNFDYCYGRDVLWWSIIHTFLFRRCYSWPKHKI